MTSLKLARAGSARAPHQWPEADAPIAARPGFSHSQGPAGSTLVDSDAERAELESAFSDLTNREREVLFALCDGGSNEHVADRLFIALPTLRTHLMRLHQKLGTSGKSELVGLVWRRLAEGYRCGRLSARSPEVGRSGN